MATYKEIHGVKIQYRESDATAIEGDVWYNASTSKIRMIASAGSWSSGGNLNTGRESYHGAGVSNSSAIVFGGAPGDKDECESYDGSSWSEVGDLNTARDTKSSSGTKTSDI